MDDRMAEGRTNGESRQREGGREGGREAGRDRWRAGKGGERSGKIRAAPMRSRLADALAKAGEMGLGGPSPVAPPPS